MHRINFSKKIQLFIVKLFIYLLNFTLAVFNKILFKKIKYPPKKILIYRTGNIGDIICATPSFIAVRRNYPEAKVTLLTSPGKKENLGARELLGGAQYFDELKIYYTEDIDSWKKKIELANNLKMANYDLFIELPNDLANFRTLFRNIFFAKFIGIKSTFGSKIRNIQLFKKTQTDYTFEKNEVENLLDILRENSLKIDKVEFGFDILPDRRDKIDRLIREKWGELNKNEIVVAINPGGNRNANQWPPSLFNKIAKYLQDKYNVKIIIIGGKIDILKAAIIRRNIIEKNVLVTAGKADILETILLLKRCSFIISNDTGAVHMASAVSLPVVGLYGVRYIFGKWFPYGSQHKILFHKFLNCDYNKEECIKRSVEMISVEEVKVACDKMIKEIYGLSR